MAIDQSVLQSIRDEFREMHDNSGQVIKVSPSGNYTGYGDVVDRLDRDYCREQLLKLCSGANGSPLGGASCVIFKLKGGDVQIAFMNNFHEYLPFKEYVSPIPA